MGGGSNTPPAVPTPPPNPQQNNQAPQQAPQQAPSSEKPFNDEPFDAGVEADEETDPKKFIEQLTGKLGQSLRKYTSSTGQPDFKLEKFAVNSILAAAHTGDMNEKDQNDIIKKVKKSKTNPDSQSMPQEEPQNAEVNTLPSDTNEPQEEPQNEPLNEADMDKPGVKAIKKAYMSSDEKTKKIIYRKVAYGNDYENTKMFLEALEDDFDDDEIASLIKKIKDEGIEINIGVSEGQYFLDNPPKNNMFQDGSNDILEQKCWQGYKKVGTQVKNGKVVNRCVKIKK